MGPRNGYIDLSTHSHKQTKKQSSPMNVSHNDVRIMPAGAQNEEIMTQEIADDDEED